MANYDGIELDVMQTGQLGKAVDLTSQTQIAYESMFVPIYMDTIQADTSRNATRVSAYLYEYDKRAFDFSFVDKNGSNLEIVDYSVKVLPSGLTVAHSLSDNAIQLVVGNDTDNLPIGIYEVKINAVLENSISHVIILVIHVMGGV